MIPFYYHYFVNVSHCELANGSISVIVELQKGGPIKYYEVFGPGGSILEGSDFFRDSSSQLRLVQQN